MNKANLGEMLRKINRNYPKLTYMGGLGLQIVSGFMHMDPAQRLCVKKLLNPECKESM